MIARRRVTLTCRVCSTAREYRPSEVAHYTSRNAETKEYTCRDCFRTELSSTTHDVFCSRCGKPRRLTAGRRRRLKTTLCFDCSSSDNVRHMQDVNLATLGVGRKDSAEDRKEAHRNLLAPTRRTVRIGPRVWS